MFTRVTMSKIPQNCETSYYEKLQGGRQSRPPSRAEKHRQSTSKASDIANRLYDRNRFDIVKHDCLSKGVHSAIRSQSLPPRPPTRRKPSDMPVPNEYSSRARSSGPTSRRGNVQKLRSARSQRSANSTPTYAHFATSVKPNSDQEVDQKQVNSRPNTPPTSAPRNAKSKQRDTSFRNNVSDHEYLQFSLRITEDIIRNDLYTNKEMRRVFKSHLEANRGRLDMNKMTQQINNLCKELNIPLDDETQDDDLVTRSQIKASRQTVKSSLACICGPVFRPLGADLKECECGSARCLPFQCVQHGNVENAEDKSTGQCSVISSNESTVRGDKFEGGGEERSTPDVFNEDSFEAHFFENPENDMQTCVSNPSVSLNENEMYQKIPLDDDKEYIVHIRQSVGCMKLPSLSRVTERTEPTTSYESVDTKLETSDSNNIDSVSEFDASDILPGCEQDRSIPAGLSLMSNASLKKKNISFWKDTIELLHTNSPQVSDEGSEKFLIGIHSVDNTSKPKISDEQVPCLNEDVCWLTCPCDASQRSAPVEPPPQESRKGIESHDGSAQPPIATAKIKSVSPKENKSANRPQMRMVYSAPPILQSRSEPIKSFSKAPIPTPRSCSLGEAGNVNNFQYERKTLLGPSSEPATKLNNSTSTTRPCLCDEKKNDVKLEDLKIPDQSNIKIRGPNNQEEEFVLVPGPIYVPKSSIMPTKARNNIPIISPQTFIRRDILTFSKDAIVNTEEESLANPDNKKLNVIKKPSISSNMSSFTDSVGNNPSTPKNTTSDTTTYSQLHTTALDTVHYTSFASNISHIPDNVALQADPISESALLAENVLKSIGEPPRAVLKRNLYMSAPPQAFCPYTNCTLTRLNDYDLTPQRDSNNSTSKSLDKPILFKKDSLLLGDEYEIKDNFNVKSSTISCYENGLPNAICKFYPNISTQTRSSDFLLTASFNVNRPENDAQREPKKLFRAANYVQQLKEQQEFQKRLESQEQRGSQEQLESQGRQESEEQQNSSRQQTKEEQERKEPTDQLQDDSGETKPHSCDEDKEDKEEDFLDLLQIRYVEEIADEEDEKTDIPAEKGEQHDEDNYDKDEDREENAEDEMKGDNENEDIFKTLDKTPSIVHRSSMMLTVKQVTSDLERFRKTEIPVEEFLQAKYNIPTRSLVVADDLQQRSSAVGSAEDRQESQDAKLPFIEVGKSEIELESKKKPGSELNTICCGLKKIQKKKRSDIVDLDESLHNMPNISTIPDDQLFEVEPRRPTVASASGYGNERKSLRFDYSPMSQFSQPQPGDDEYLNRRETIDIKDFTSSFSKSFSVADVTPPHSEDLLPVVRNPVVSYRSPSMPSQPPTDKKASTASGVSFDCNNVTSDDCHDSVVDILPPTQEELSMTSIQIMANPENGTKRNSEAGHSNDNNMD